MLPTTIKSTVQGVAGPFIGTATRNYALTRQGVSDSIYRDPTSTLADPRTIRVAHEVSKDGNNVNSAIILRQEVTDSVTMKTGAFQVLLKVTYDASLVTKAQLVEGILEIGSICCRATGCAEDFDVNDGGPSSASMGSNIEILPFLNLEH